MSLDFSKLIDRSEHYFAGDPKSKYCHNVSETILEEDDDDLFELNEQYISPKVFR